MPATIIETHGSRSFVIGVNSGTAVWTYFVHGEEDEAAVDVLVQNTAPEQWYAFTRDNIDAKRRNRLDQWDVTVNYKILAYEVATGDLPAPGSVPTGDPVGNPAPAPSPSASPPADEQILDGVTFSVTLENEHIDRSLATVTSAVKLGPDAVGEFNEKYGAIPGKIGGLIGVVLDGNGGKKIMGCDKGSPVATVRKKATIQGMNFRFLRTLMLMAGKSNHAAWWIFGEEDAAFVGCEGQQLDFAGRFEMTFEWLYRLPVENKVWGTVPSSTGGADIDLVATKRGMQFVWFGYAERMVNGEPVPRVNEVFVERIFETDDFNWLGI